MDINTRVIRNNFVWAGDTVTINDDTTPNNTFEQVAVQGNTASSVPWVRSTSGLVVQALAPPKAFWLRPVRPLSLP